MSHPNSAKLSCAVETLIESGMALPADDANAQNLASFDVIIVGSGYGGAVAAARLGGATEQGRTLKIAILERGKEISPGEFPNTFAELPGELRIQRHDDDQLIGNADAMFELRLGKTVHTLTGNGLGGGSLINAAVAEAPHPDVWQHPAWPTPLRKDPALSTFFETAKQTLGAAKLQDGATPTPRKLQALKKLGDQIDPQAFRQVDIAIEMRHCVQCGDCVTGCNFNAKNTLPKTYLAQARAKQVEMYTGATVSHIQRHQEQCNDGQFKQVWLVYFVLTSAKAHSSMQTLWMLKADHLILSAGSIGSTEILQRSLNYDQELGLSPQLGRSFSCNGDMIWSGYDQTEAVNAIADPSVAIEEREVGPTITGMIDLRHQTPPHLIQDASIPAPLKRVFEEILTTNALAYRMVQRDSDERDPTLDPDAVDPKKIAHTATYLSMGVDRAIGEIRFTNDTPDSNTGLKGRSHPHWGEENEDSPLPEEETDNVCQDPVYLQTEQHLQSVQKLGGMLLPSPNYRIAPKVLLDQLSGKRGLNSVLTVHPLGGCGMGEDSEQGVVNHYGAVFRHHPTNLKRSELQHGLYVLDGAIMPCALGINPLLTISALAERAVGLIAERENWQLTNKLTPALPEKSLPAKIKVKPLTPPEKLGFSFQEVMRWEISSEVEKARLKNSILMGASEAKLVVDFHIGDQDLAGFLRNPKRQVVIMKAKIVISRIGQKEPDTYELTGTVDWLWEQAQTAQEKETYGFTHFLRSRALADIAAHPNLSSGLKLFLSPIIRFLNDRKLTLPSALYQFTGKLFKQLRHFLALATHTGGHRHLRYRLHNADRSLVLTGLKDVNYGDGSNIWRSLSDLRVQLQVNGQQVSGLLFSLDWNEIFKSKSFQLDRTSSGLPRNPDLWLDLISIGAFWARALIRIHFWSFRLPEVQTKTRQCLLPALPKFQHDFHRIELLDRSGQKIEIALSHFTTPSSTIASLPPLIMIHGFGASGLQFAAPGSQKSMAAYFVESGRDVWIAELRTSIAMNRSLPDKKAQWSMDEVAQEDIPKLINFVLEKTKAKRVDILAHCIGSAMFNISVLSGRLMHTDQITPLIRCAALLQVGPIFTVSRGNKLRAYMAYLAGRGLDIDFIDSSTDLASEDASNTLIDRMLASYPVPEEEIEDQDPSRCLYPVPPNNQWQANYYRSSGVFGRLFSISNLSSAMLNQLGELLGRTNFKTFQQIIQSVMRNRLVDEHGRNRYVTPHNFKKYYSFPTRFFYGEKNDVFGIEGIQDSVQQLRSANGWGEGEDPRLAQAFSQHIFKDYGHLDPIIGINSARDIYPALKDFLNTDAHAFIPPQKAESLYLREADYGPLIGWTRLEQNQWISRVWLSARETAGIPLYAAIYRYKEQVVSDLQLIPVQHLLRFQYVVIDCHLKNEQDRLFLSFLHQGVQDGSGDRYTEITCNAFDQMQAKHDVQRPPPHRNNTISIPDANEAIADLTAFQSTAQSELELAIQTAINRLPRNSDQEKAIYPPCFSTLIAPKLANPTQTSHRIALGSCRYSGTPIEFFRSNAPYQDLLPHLSSQDSPDLMLLMGDQIYLDATAGTADPSDTASIMSFHHRSMERRCNHQTLAAPRVMAQLPSYMIWDDHEISDNWNTQEDIENPKKQAYYEMAKAALLAHQWSHGPRNAHWQDSGSFCTSFSHGEIDFFVLDTRLERTPSLPHSNASIVSDRQFEELASWLAQTKNQGRLRLIVSPSQIHNMEDAHRFRSDAWSAYSQSLTRLALMLKDENQIGILCGDQHLHGLYSLDYLDQRGQSIQAIPVIVASPLYAPYPFINPRNDLPAGHSDNLLTLEDELTLHYRLVASHGEYQGFSLLDLERIDQQWRGVLWQVDAQTALFQGIDRILF